MTQVRAVRMWLAGVTVAEIAERLGQPRYTVRQWVRDVEKPAGEEEPRAPGLLPLEESSHPINLDYRRIDPGDQELLDLCAGHQFEYEGDIE